MIDKYNLTQREQLFLLKKNIVELIYNAGQFENLKTTLLQTEQIVKYNKAYDVDIDEVLTIVNLKRGFQHIYNVGAVDKNNILSFAKDINKIVAQEDALYPGEFRTNIVQVNTFDGLYYPPTISDEILNGLKEILQDTRISNTDKAIEVFLYIAKNQLFWDGNKRTGIIVANKILFDNGNGLLSIPQKDYNDFQRPLSDFYNHGSEDVKIFLKEKCIHGIN